MEITKFNLVSQYIEDTVIQSFVWDNADIKIRKKAVRRAEITLRNILFDVFGTEEIPVEIVGEQAVWILKLDDTIERAELGMKNVWVDGTMITVSDKDNSICPLIYKMLGIPVTKTGKRRRVGNYQGYTQYTGRWSNKVQILGRWYNGKNYTDRT